MTGLCQCFKAGISQCIRRNHITGAEHAQNNGGQTVLGSADHDNSIRVNGRKTAQLQVISNNNPLLMPPGVRQIMQQTFQIAAHG